MTVGNEGQRTATFAAAFATRPTAATSRGSAGAPNATCACMSSRACPVESQRSTEGLPLRPPCAGVGRGRACRRPRVLEPVRGGQHRDGRVCADPSIRDPTTRASLQVVQHWLRDGPQTRTVFRPGRLPAGLAVDRSCFAVRTAEIPADHDAGYSGTRAAIEIHSRSGTLLHTITEATGAIALLGDRLAVATSSTRARSCASTVFPAGAASPRPAFARSVG